MAQKRMFIYKITNTANGKIYIGRTSCSIIKRFNQHVSDSKYIHTENPLHVDIRKYGRDCFIIEKIKEFYTDDYYVADTVELECINENDCWYPKGYNKRKVHREDGK